jgi:tagatose-6-phosphate ketose/aldose isomerase
MQLIFKFRPFKSMTNTPFFTEKEIKQQAALWQKVYTQLLSLKDNLTDFLAPLKEEDDSEVIFTGAGSSFFVGEMVAGYFQKNSGLSSKAISTTEIVTHPAFYINPKKRTLLVSFARSGNSPESVAAIRNSDKVSDKILHLIITCNSEGELAKMASANKKYILTLPEEANDKGLAMTSSVSSMALTALLISHLEEIELLQGQIEIASRYANHIISTYSAPIRQLAELNFKRAVFLGSGPFLGVAREAHLKLQEMTDGKVICKFDSFLAFRHGPKVVLDENTLLVYFFSNDEYVLKYETDLIESVEKDHKLLAVMGVSETKLDHPAFDLDINMGASAGELNEEFLTLCSLIPAQLLGFYKSIQIGLNPDQPSNGTIHRVVQGVNIYDFQNKVLIS